MVISPVVLFFEATIGDTGAITLASSPANKGISSVVRSDTGLYLITLQDSYYKLLACQPERPIEESGGADPQVWGAVYAEDVDSVTTPTITVQYRVEGGTATDPNSGATLKFPIWLDNSGA